MKYKIGQLVRFKIKGPLDYPIVELVDTVWHRTGRWLIINQETMKSIGMVIGGIKYDYDVGPFTEVIEPVVLVNDCTIKVGHDEIEEYAPPH